MHLFKAMSVLFAFPMRPAALQLLRLFYLLQILPPQPARLQPLPLQLPRVPLPTYPHQSHLLLTLRHDFLIWMQNRKVRDCKSNLSPFDFVFFAICVYVCVCVCVYVFVYVYVYVCVCVSV
jgi:hypothetical protein